MATPGPGTLAIAIEEGGPLGDTNQFLHFVYKLWRKLGIYLQKYNVNENAKGVVKNLLQFTMIELVEQKGKLLTGTQLITDNHGKIYYHTIQL